MSCGSGEIHVGDIGTALIVTFHNDDASIKDISEATLLNIILRDSNNNVTTFMASLVNTGTDGLAQYTTSSASDLSVAGFWYLQGYVEINASHHNSNIVKFQVFPNLS